MKFFSSRKALFLTAVLTGVAVAPAALVAQSPQASRVESTFVYKVVGETRIEADVYWTEGAVMRPVVMWIHGGALIFGSRAGVPPQLRALCESNGFVLVSIDYRLAPEVKLPAIASDLDDAIIWVREEGSELFGADPDTLAVVGGSAGGYLALMSGFRATPPPTVVASFWGYGAADAPFDSEPSEFYRTSMELVSREDALASVGGEVLTGTGSGPGGRWPYYLYLRQTGLWPEEVTGLDPATQQAELDSYAPVRNVTPVFPPTVFVHGTNDNDVPHEESVGMAAELETHGVVHDLVLVEGAGHGLSGVGGEVLTEVIDRALSFIERHLR